MCTILYLPVLVQTISFPWEAKSIGIVMASMALLIKVHKKNFPGRAYVSQIDDPSYKICKVLTDIINPLDERGESYIKDTYHFKEMLKEVDIEAET